MVRLAFLFLVILGALAALVSLFVGMGLYQAAKLQDASVAASAPVTTLPSSKPSSIAQSVEQRPVVQTAPASLPVRPIADPPVRQAVVAVPPDRPVVLSVKDAVLIGDDLRLDPVALQTVIDWTNRRDGLEWTAQVPASGLYDVEITYSCDRTDGGGVFTIRAGPGGLSASVRPTASWDDYQSQYAGKLYLQQGPTQLFMRPVYMLPGGRLMNLRAVTLKFVKQIDEPVLRPPFSRRRGF